MGRYHTVIAAVTYVIQIPRRTQTHRTSCNKIYNFSPVDRMMATGRAIGGGGGGGSIVLG
jgi:hypothetical protein